MGVGAEQQFAEFYSANYARTVGELCLIAESRAEAEDVAQEAYCRAWARWSRLAVYDDPHAWIRRVAYNLAVSKWRRRRRLMHLLPRLSPAPTGDEADPDWVDLRDQLRQLPPRAREALVWTALVGLTAEEAAREMKVRSSTVRSWLYRARAATVGARCDETTI